ncbi:type VII secretion protein EccB [Actinomycetospora callitridis]|uniref:type VII secretion protein EccB n=1 Tax=Actinomycetospora callitridis TaxID=913944 RepID=UPI0023665DDB|nr:type VII secretion protein EccB [Actinomycetospora callitridis]MDD7921033.1 type VII secretion protein EccB [Actinomycetospora callitridis]
MPPPTTTSDQVHAYRFGLRRLQSALVRRQAVPGVDPLRAQHRATLAGVLIAVLALGVAAVWGLLDRPADWRTAGVVVAEGSGALYVVVHGPDRLVPVPNLASARLVLAGLAAAGGPAGNPEPVEVAESDLATAPRERGVGIVDAPPLPPAGAPVPPVWSVCDTGSPRPGAARPWEQPRVWTTVLAGPTAPGQALGPERGLLLRDRFDGTWLVHDGVRSRLDLRDPAVVVAFDLEGQLPRPVSTSLLNTLTEGPAIVAPAIAGRGEVPPGGPLVGEPVGGVVRLVGPGTPDRWYVVQREGVQEVPEVVARLVRLSDADPARAAAPVPVVSPGQLRPLATARGIAVSAYPDPVPRAVPMAEAPTTCASADGAGAVVLTVGAEPPATAVPPTTLAQADGSGDRVDAVALPGGGVTVRAVPAGRPDAPGSPTVVSGAGTTSAVPDPETAAALGLGEAFPPAPGAVVGLLPVGPVLSITDALTPLPAGG